MKKLELDEVRDAGINNYSHHTCINVTYPVVKHVIRTLIMWFLVQKC
jgi:hypothetical protein